MIDAKWIDHWAKQYPDEYDDDVLNRVGPRARKQGCYDRKDLLTVGTHGRALAPSHD